MIRQQLSDIVTLSAVAGDTINVSATAIGATQNNPGADQLVLHIDYTKGTEAGVYVYVVFPTTSVATDNYTEGRWTDTGGGVLILDGAQRFLLSADTTTDIAIDLRSRPYFKVYQISNGAVGATPGKIIVKSVIFG